MQMHYEHQPRVQGLILSRWSMYSLQVTLHKSRFVVDNHSDIPHAVHANRGTGARNTCGMNDGQRCQRGWEIMDREPCLTEHLPYISTGFGLSSARREYFGRVVASRSHHGKARRTLCWIAYLSTKVWHLKPDMYSLKRLSMVCGEPVTWRGSRLARSIGTPFSHTFLD